LLLLLLLLLLMLLLLLLLLLELLTVADCRQLILLSIVGLCLPSCTAYLPRRHFGDLFYLGVGIVVWFFCWPKDDEARIWPSVAALPVSWIARVALRNLVINISIYEFWHQLLFGGLATPSIRMHRYNNRDPYANGRHLTRERLCSVCGFLWSTAYVCQPVSLCVALCCCRQISPCIQLLLHPKWFSLPLHCRTWLLGRHTP